MANLSPRQGRILEFVREQGFVSIEGLAGHFGVTPQTVRRDINQLCERQLLRRYHGGAGLPSSVENAPYATRQVMQLVEKRRIARLVAQHIPDNASLFINIGTTTEEVARALIHHEGLRVITNNINVASIMASNPRFEVIVAGGLVRHHDGGIVGEAAIDLIRQFKVDYGIVGISGIDLDGSLLDFDYREVRVAKAIIENARRVFLVADHTKFGRNALVRLGHVDQVHALFTDRPLPADFAEAFAATGVTTYCPAPDDQTAADDGVALNGDEREAAGIAS